MKVYNVGPRKALVLVLADGREIRIVQMPGWALGIDAPADVRYELDCDRRVMPILVK